MSYRIVQRRKVWYIFSLLLIGASVVFVFLGGFKLGTDFNGGTQIQLGFTARPPVQEISAFSSSLGYGAATAQSVDASSVLIRMRELTQEEHASILQKMSDRFPGAKEEAFTIVGPVIGRELRQRAVVATVLVLLAIIAYISWAFRKSSRRLSGWAFGVNAIIALIHDIVITVGFFAFLGYVVHVEIDVLFVTALLTTLGFSVHDTIVVFDRLREGMQRSSEQNLETLINDSVNTTLVRSINTSLTTILVLVALYLFGGSSIKQFVLALIVGITIGTYSSVFIASPLLLFWDKRKKV